ncbi:MAG: MgtC/SapB family protein [Inquilinaceae bacterium]
MLEGWGIVPHTPIGEIAIRLGLACIFGLFIGLDREIRGKSAGLRTHMLICLGAATTTLIALELIAATAVPDDDRVRTDPLRVIEAVVAAIGFLGAGAIIQARGAVHGLTSAANIWLAGIIGLACGGGYYVIAGIAFLFNIFILTVMNLLEERFARPSGKRRDGDV